jgi:ATP-dependent helicase/nuclease subunit B
VTDVDATLAALRSAGLFRSLRTVESAQGPRVRLDGREVLLTAYADRIDILAGGLRILDYKTGEPPSGEAVRDGRKPQLTLEAAIAAHGGFEGIAAADAAALLYWKLSGGPKPGEERMAAEGAELVRALGDQAQTALLGLVSDFLLGNRAFVARPHPKRAPAGSDYDHLSRLAEWAGAEDARGAP